MLKNKYLLGSVFALAFISTMQVANALPTIDKSAKKAALKTTASGCTPATANIDLDINNVRSRLMTGGDMWWDQGTRNAAYEVPKGSKKTALYAGSVWVAGIQNGSLKTAAQLFRGDGNDYWPGPLNYNDGTFTINEDVCNEWDRFWKIDRSTVEEFKELGGNRSAAKTEKYKTIWEWPARGNGITVSNGPANNNDYSKAKGKTGAILEMDDREYAPFVDVDGNGVYNPEDKDYPNMEDPGRGDQMVWWVFNDRGNTKLQTKSESIGLEIQTSAFAFATKDFLNDATFYNYRVMNRAGLTLDSAYMATWTDADLGYAFDDYIGCDTGRGLGILYNATNVDGNGEPYAYGANPPMVGVDFFIGPKKYYKNPVTGLDDSVRKLKMQAFTYFINNSPINELNDPQKAIEFYYYMTGSRKNGKLFSYDFKSPGSPCTGIGQGNPVKFVYAGEVNSGWSECVCQNAPGDRRFIHSAGPFQLRPGAVDDIVIGAVWVASAGGCPIGNFKKIKVADDLTQVLFDSDFKLVEGPQAPNVTYREMDRKVILYWQNDYGSNNYGEKYGYEPDSAKYRVVSKKAVLVGSPDSIYKFEGYRIFQLKNAFVTSAQIFNEKGVLDETVAREVKGAQCDIKNDVKQLVNFQKNIEIDGCDNCYDAVIKVNGQDSGIKHSFVVTQDAFATGADQQLVNYKTYYFLVIAYAYNKFAAFDPINADATQDAVYLESRNGRVGSETKTLDQMILKVMPNPANGDMGTYLNADYGSGVVITKLEGKGNGGNDIQMNEMSEKMSLSATEGYQSKQPIYEAGKGPINIKVVDPLKVQKGNWVFYLTKDTNATGGFNSNSPGTDTGGNVIGKNAKWVLVKDGDVANPIYSEGNLDKLDEQILAEYGLSVSVRQMPSPGRDQTSFSNNGYITSDVKYDDPALSWLAGIPDGEQQSPLNWIRSGQYAVNANEVPPIRCNYKDVAYDTMQYYEKMFKDNAAIFSSWAPYALGAIDDSFNCAFGITQKNSSRPLFDVASVDLVFTSDKTKWSRCIVLEMAADGGASTPPSPLAEGGALKFKMRKHRSWTGNVDANGMPEYASDPSDMGFSYFPGYAINQETGERLNIVFSEDSYLQADNGRDMIWNPSSRIFDLSGNNVFGGKHFVYISKTKYDECDTLVKLLNSSSSIIANRAAYETFIWAGMPLSSSLIPMLSLKDGLIPTTTRLRFRTSMYYSYYAPPGITLTNGGYPKYQFSTDDLAPATLADGNPYSSDKKQLLDRIHAVPNPYYAHSYYEAQQNRLNQTVRIINLPRKATVSIYSLDGSLIKTLTKDDDLAYIDWDIRNSKGLQIASGMYIMHVKAEGIGERVIKWFGAMRPVDVNSF